MTQALPFLLTKWFGSPNEKAWNCLSSVQPVGWKQQPMGTEEELAAAWEQDAAYLLCCCRPDTHSSAQHKEGL